MRALLLHHISWQNYEAFLRELEGRRFRITYDKGSMEVAERALQHEHASELLSRIVQSVTMELYIPIRSGGSTRLKDEALEKGLEPDKCFWIQNEKRMRGKKKFVIDRDPPPDLALEIEITRSALDRLGIYAALRIPEVWRWDGESLRVNHLAANGKYLEKSQSRAFPFLPISKFSDFLRQTETIDETTLLHTFVAWVREELEPLIAKSSAKTNGKRPSK